MQKTTISPKAMLAKNLRALIEMQGLGVYQVATAGKVVPKTVYNLRNGTHDPRLSSIEKAANTFGLSAWQLLVTDLESVKPPDQIAVLRLLEHYMSADEAGRIAILQVAEMAAKKSSL